jgi:hypothetical protein
MGVTEARAAAGTTRSTVIGRLTRAGEPAFGYRVVCWHHLGIGIPDAGHGCVADAPQVRKVGEAKANDNGDFAVTFDALAEPASECFLDSLVRVEVFDGDTRVWASGFAVLAPLVRFDAELQPT